MGSQPQLPGILIPEGSDFAPSQTPSQLAVLFSCFLRPTESTTKVFFLPFYMDWFWTLFLLLYTTIVPGKNFSQRIALILLETTLLRSMAPISVRPIESRLFNGHLELISGSRDPRASIHDLGNSIAFVVACALRGINPFELIELFS